MEIGNFLPTGETQQPLYPLQRHERDRIARTEAGDTVRISAEALALAREMYSSAFGVSLAMDSDEGEVLSASSEAVTGYKSLFDDYRGMGLFEELDAEGTASSGPSDSRIFPKRRT